MTLVCKWHTHHGSEVMSAGVVVVVASRLSRIVVSVLVQSARGCRCRCLLIGCLFATIAREAGIVVVAIDFTIITAIGRVRPSPIIARISSGACRTVAVVVNIAIARRSICIADTTDRISALGFQARSRHITFVYSWQVIRGRSAITIWDMKGYGWVHRGSISATHLSTVSITTPW